MSRSSSERSVSYRSGKTGNRQLSRNVLALAGRYGGAVGQQVQKDTTKEHRTKNSDSKNDANYRLKYENDILQQKLHCLEEKNKALDKYIDTLRLKTYTANSKGTSGSSSASSLHISLNAENIQIGHSNSVTESSNSSLQDLGEIIEETLNCAVEKMVDAVKDKQTNVSGVEFRDSVLLNECIDAIRSHTNGPDQLNIYDSLPKKGKDGILIIQKKYCQSMSGRMIMTISTFCELLSVKKDVHEWDNIHAALQRDDCVRCLVRWINTSSTNNAEMLEALLR